MIVNGWLHGNIPSKHNLIDVIRVIITGIIIKYNFLFIKGDTRIIFVNLNIIWLKLIWKDQKGLKSNYKMNEKDIFKLFKKQV